MANNTATHVISIVLDRDRDGAPEAGAGASDLIYLLGPCGDGDGMAGERGLNDMEDEPFKHVF